MDDIYMGIFLKETFCVLIQIQYCFVPDSPTDNKLAFRWVNARKT